MLDSNLPTYFFRASTDSSRRYDYSLLFTQNGSEPDPSYTLRFPDPTTPVGKNVYACALFDAYVADILYGEVLLRPVWQQPTLSAQEIRAASGVPPPPAPIIPHEFAVQLYNPDQQVIVSEKSGSWSSSAYHFSMPQYTFRTPSGSSLDRSTNDPTADVTTPLLRFVWRKEGTLSNSWACFLTGKSTDTKQKNKGGKEPDIMVAVLSNYRDMTIYESNFHRIDMEDYKGLEIVLLLCSSTLRDVYCGQRKDCFNVGEQPRKMSRKKSTPFLSANTNASTMNLGAPTSTPMPPAPPSWQNMQANNLANGHARPHSTPPSAPPPPDRREQWQIDADATRLRKQQENESRMTDYRRKEKQKADEVEARRIRKMLEAEDKDRRKREAEIEKETARLRKQYGDQANLLPNQRLPAPRPPHTGALSYQHQRLAAPTYNNSSPNHASAHQLRPNTHLAHGPVPSTGPYLQPAASMTSFFHGPSTAPPQQPQPRPKKSFLGLRRMSEGGTTGNELQKKKSSFW